MVKVTLDTEQFKSKPTGQVTGKIQSRFKSKYDKYLVEITPLELLYKVGKQGHSWKPAVFDGEGTGNNNFKELHVLGIDIDDVENWAIKDTQELLAKYNLDYTGIYKTFSYTDQKQKHRIIFELPAVVLDKRLVTLLYLFFMEILPADRACKDPARLFFGGINNPIEGTGRALNLVTLYYAFCSEIDKLSSGTKTNKLKEIGAKVGLDVINGQLDIQIGENAKNYSITETPIVLYRNIDETVKSCNLLFPNFQTAQLSYKTRGRGAKSYEDVTKSWEVQSETLNYGTVKYDLITLANNCQLYDDVVYGGYWVYHDTLRLLAYNLHPIEGAIKAITEAQIYNGKGNTSYVYKMKNLVNTALKKEYLPEHCTESNCPYYADCKIIKRGHKSIHSFITYEGLKQVNFIDDIWKQEDFNGNIPLEIADLVKFQGKDNLKNIEEEASMVFDNYFSELSKCEDNRGLMVLKAPTGLGKTEMLIKANWDIFKGKRVAIAVPTHKLKDELVERFKQTGINVTAKPARVTLKDEDVERNVQNLLEIGHSKASVIYHKHLHENKEMIKDYADYLNKLDAYSNASIAITTHSDILQCFPDFDYIIVDEDILLSSTETKTISLNGLKRDILLLKNEIDYCIDVLDIILDFANDDKQKVLDLSFNEGIKGKALNAVERLTEEGDLYNGILKIISAQFMVKEGNSIHFGKRRELPRVPMMVLSATALQQVYDIAYFCKRHLTFHSLDIVEDGGKLTQDLSYSFSRSKLKNNGNTCLGYIKEFIVDTGRNLKDYTVLTFKNHVETFKEAGFNVAEDIYFGNTCGYDVLNGKNLIVAGTPHIPSGDILLTALLFFDNMVATEETGYTFEEVETAELNTMKCYQINGVELRFPSFDNPYIRLTQLYLIQSELLQAIGRARLVRNKDKEVILFSNFPLRETNSFYKFNNKLR